MHVHRPTQLAAFIGRTGLLIVLAAIVPARASAQDQGTPAATRSSLLESARDAKVTESEPAQRSTVERALYWYDNQSVLTRIFGGWRGFRLAGGSFPAGAGTKFGVGFSQGPGSSVSQETRGSNRVGVDVIGAYSTRGYWRASGAATVKDLGGAPLDLTVRGQRYEFPQEDFFGLGPDSSQDNRTNYLLDNTEAGAELRWRPSRFVEIAGGAFYEKPEVASGKDSRFPSTEALFDPSTLPGFSEQTTFLRTDASVAFDWRDNGRHPHAGGRYGVQFSNFADRDLDAFDFRRVHIDAQQYVPLPNRYRTIALHAAATLTDADAGQQVPFYYQPTLGGGQALRGFREFRFRDRNSVLVSAEYRWEAWWALDGALFVDAGTVASDRRDLSLRNVETSYGIGFRVHSNSAFVARLDLAFSREGFIPLLRFEHVF